MKKDLEGRPPARMSDEQWRRLIDRFPPEQRPVLWERVMRGRRRKGPGKSGGLPQPADPRRPLAGEGGAAAPLEFDT